MKNQLGIQPICWSNDDFRDLGAEISLEQCLSEMKEAGYHGTELGHKFPKEPETLHKLLQKFDLSLVTAWHSTYLATQDLKTEIQRFSENLLFLKKMNCKVAVVAECSYSVYPDEKKPLHYSPSPDLLYPEEWDRLTKGLHQLTQLSRKEGIELVYHPHLGTVIQSPSQIDQLAERVPEMGWVFDTGHLYAAGVDLDTFLKKYRNRIHHLHLKDVRDSVLKQSQAKKWSFSQSVRSGLFTVPGDGSIPFEKILGTFFQKTYHGWAIVEAEQDPKKANPLEYAKKGRRFLLKLISNQITNQQEGQNMNPTKMQKTQELGTDFWNDSCHHDELSQAVEQGAVGATSNPVIAFAAIHNDQSRWLPVLDQLICQNSYSTEDEIAWLLIEEMGKHAARLLKPVFDKSSGKKGVLCMQVSPKYYRNTESMVQHGVHLASLAPNIAIKCPATQKGIQAMEELVSQGIRVNATVSFSVPQALAAASAIEKGLDQARAKGLSTETLQSYITLMVGRIDDQIKRAIAQEKITIHPSYSNWAGVAVFKKAHKLFIKENFSSTLLAAAYRHPLHWTELVGDHVVQSIPYAWWKQFNDSDITVKKTIGQDVDPEMISEMIEKIPDFRKAYLTDGMKIEGFESYGASIHTLRQFLGGYQDLVEFVRSRMF